MAEKNEERVSVQPKPVSKTKKNELVGTVVSGGDRRVTIEFEWPELSKGEERAAQMQAFKRLAQELRGKTVKVDVIG